MKQPQRTAVKATCSRTGREYHFESISETAHAGYSVTAVRDCVRGRSKTHGGMVWEATTPLRPVMNGGSPRVRAAAAHYNAGLSYEETAEKMGLAVSTVRLYISQARTLGIVTKMEPKAYRPGNPIGVIATCIQSGTVHHYRSTQDAADEGGFSQSCVSRCIRGLQADHAGFTFKATRSLAPPREATKKRTQQVMALKEKGHRIVDIARELKIGTATVYYHLQGAKA